MPPTTSVRHVFSDASGDLPQLGPGVGPTLNREVATAPKGSNGRRACWYSPKCLGAAKTNPKITACISTASSLLAPCERIHAALGTFF
jgi:hypothetical protein